MGSGRYISGGELIEDVIDWIEREREREIRDGKKGGASCVEVWWERRPVSR